MSMTSDDTTANPAVEQARAALIDALVYAGTVIMNNLDGASEADRAEADRALEEAKLRGITLSTLLAEQDGEP